MMMRIDCVKVLWFIFAVLNPKFYGWKWVELVVCTFGNVGLARPREKRGMSHGSESRQIYDIGM